MKPDSVPPSVPTSIAPSGPSSPHQPIHISALCQAINTVKRSAHDAERIDLEQYLGGDLGIDSIEMLEIWFHAEKQLGILLPDDAKREVYTLAEAVAVLACQHQTQVGEAAHV